MQVVVRLVLGVILVLSAAKGYAQLAADSEMPLVRVGIMMFPGFSEMDEHGQAVGKTVRLTRRLLEQAGYRAEIRIMPAARIWRGLEGGQVHLWPGIVNKPGLDSHTLLTDRDLGQVGINLYYRAGEPVPELSSGLDGKRLIRITNYTYIQSLVSKLNDPGSGLVPVSSISHRGALQMLLKRRGDYLLDYEVQIEAAARELGIDVPPSVQLAEQPMRFVLSLNSGFAPQLKADLDRAFDELAARGEELDVTRQ